MKRYRIDLGYNNSVTSYHWRLKQCSLKQILTISLYKPNIALGC